MVRTQQKHAAKKKGWVVPNAATMATKFAIKVDNNKGFHENRLKREYQLQYPTAPEPKATSMIYQSNWPLVFRRYYKMTRESFWIFCNKLDDGVAAASRAMASWKKEQEKKGLMNNNANSDSAQNTAKENDYKPSSLPSVAPHRNILTTTCLLCTIRYLEGDSLLNLSQANEITQREVHEAVWYCVYAVHQLEEFQNKYSAEHEKLRMMASDLSHVTTLRLDPSTTFALRIFLHSSNKKKPVPRKKR